MRLIYPADVVSMNEMELGLGVGGFEEGLLLGTDDGFEVGAIGTGVGTDVGLLDGAGEGLGDGIADGTGDGFVEGLGEGRFDGFSEGFVVGEFVGIEQDKLPISDPDPDVVVVLTPLTNI